MSIPLNQYNMSSIKTINKIIKGAKFLGNDIGGVSDGYHTFDELYKFRAVYNALLFNEWAVSGKFDVHKSKRHNDGKKCFGGDEYFVVVAMLPAGQITNHYPMELWDLFRIPETPKAKYEYDNHTSQDVLDRMLSLADFPVFKFRELDGD